ncbi:MAG TPA: hypothetical protein VGM60_02665 [Pseudonocardia sp.]|jgi:hypothetical protein|uniref:hypothetical protein n=1 Tax=Pseudonocardia sp. TaxID=60912 RepID=UPI002F3F763D
MHSNQNDVGEDGMSPLASVLSAMPEVWHSLLAQHVPDSSGRCVSCRNSGTAGVPWPCTLRVIAEDARDLNQSVEGLPGATPCGLAS